MLYEEIVLKAWEKTWKATDPMNLGSSDVFGSADNELTGDNGNALRMGLSSALRKIAAEQNGNDISDELMKLNSQVWKAKVVNDICEILVNVKAVFVKIGLMA